MNRISTFIQLLEFLRERKKYWLAPLIILIGFLGLLIVTGEASGLGPLIYPLF